MAVEHDILCAIRSGEHNYRAIAKKIGMSPSGVRWYFEETGRGVSGILVRDGFVSRTKKKDNTIRLTKKGKAFVKEYAFVPILWSALPVEKVEND